MVVAADVGEVAGGLAQAALVGGLVREQRRGPLGKRVGKGRVAAEQQAEVARRADERVLLRVVAADLFGEPAFPQPVRAEHDAARHGGTQQAAQHDRGERQVVGASAKPVHALDRAPRHRRHRARKGARFLALDLVVVHDQQRIAGFRHMETSERPEGAAHEVQIAAPRRRRSSRGARGRLRRSPWRARRRCGRGRRGGARRAAGVAARHRAARDRAARVRASRRRYRRGCRPPRASRRARRRRRRRPPARRSGCGSARPACGARGPR